MDENMLQCNNVVCFTYKIKSPCYDCKHCLRMNVERECNLEPWMSTYVACKSAVCLTYKTKKSTLQLQALPQSNYYMYPKSMNEEHTCICYNVKMYLVWLTKEEVHFTTANIVSDYMCILKEKSSSKHYEFTCCNVKVQFVWLQNKKVHVYNWKHCLKIIIIRECILKAWMSSYAAM